MRSKVRGLSVPELLVASAILGILMTSIAVVFQTGITASFKSSGRNEVLSQLRRGIRMIKSDYQQTTSDSVTVGPAATSASFLTHYDDQGRPQVHPEGRPLWQAYYIYYHEASTNQFARRRLQLAPGATQEDFPSPIEFYDAGSGLQPLSSYLSGGEPVSNLLEDVEFTLDPVYGNYMDVEFTFLKSTKSDQHSDSRAVFDLRVYSRN